MTTTFTARVEASELASALDRLKPTKCLAVELRPHAKGITLVSSGDSLSIDTEAVATASGDIVRVPSAPLSTWASRVEGDVTAELADNTVTFSARRTTLRLATMAADAAPTIWSAEPGTEPVDLGMDVWRAIGRCAPAASTDEQRTKLRSVNLEDGFVWATDSYRAYTVAAPELVPLGFIPIPSLVLAAGVLKVLDLENVEAVRGGATRNHLHLSDGRTHMVIVLMAGEPEGMPTKLVNLLPPSAKRIYKLTVSRKELIAAVDSVTVLTAEPRIALAFDGSTLTLMAGEEGRDATFEVDASGEPWPGRSGANKAYLADLLDALESDEVTLEWTDARAPVVVDDGAFSGLLMPVRHDTDGTW